jgi:hypothetical protein
MGGPERAPQAPRTRRRPGLAGPPLDFAHHVRGPDRARQAPLADGLAERAAPRA